MKILIVEDERPIVKYIDRLCRNILGQEIESIDSFYTLDSASEFLFKQSIDLCLLDLNLNGQDGFELLKLAASGSFHTIIISANTDKAIEAFKFGVLDFIPKPFDEDRLKLAFERYFDRLKTDNTSVKYLTIRKNKQTHVIHIENILFFKAAGIYVEVYLKTGEIEILDKTMDRLDQLLPDSFMRIHRSCIVDLSQIDYYEHTGGGTYQVITKKRTILPLSRQKYKELQALLS